MKKKIVIPLIIAVLGLAVIGLLVAYKNGAFYRASGQQKRFMTEINAANTIVWYYGNLDPGKEITINYKKVREFTDETIGDKENEYGNHIIVIFDFDGTMDISKQELMLIKKYCEENYYDMLYYGTEHLYQFRECGFFSVLDSGECGFTYNGSYWRNRTGKENYLNPYLLTGNWSSNDNEYYDTSDRHYMWKFVLDFVVTLVN